MNLCLKILLRMGLDVRMIILISHAKTCSVCSQNGKAKGKRPYLFVLRDFLGI